MSTGLYDRKLQGSQCFVNLLMKTNTYCILAGSDDESDASDTNYNREDVTEHDFYDDLKVNEEDELALQMFQNK